MEDQRPEPYRVRPVGVNARAMSAGFVARSDREAMAQYSVVRHSRRSPVSGIEGGRRDLRVRADCRPRVMAVRTVAALPRNVERDVAILSQTLLCRVVGYGRVGGVGFYTYATSGHTSVAQLPGDGFGARS